MSAVQKNSTPTKNPKNSLIGQKNAQSDPQRAKKPKVRKKF